MKRWATNSATVGETGRAPVLIAVAPSLTRISFFRARACCSVSSVTGPILFRTRCRITAPSGITPGAISALAGIHNDIRFLQVTSPVQPGNSGGPLLDDSGNVIGVISSKLDALKIAGITGDIPQNVNFAIKSSLLESTEFQSLSQP